LRLAGQAGDRKYYPFVFRLDGRVRWLLYYSNEPDGFDLLAGHFRLFESLDALKANLRARRIDLEEEQEEATLFDLDGLAAWLARPSSATLDASALLNAWNVFTDAAASVGENLPDRGDDKDRLYDRLFHFGGPAWHTGRQEGVVGSWTPEEVARLTQVLGRGLDVFRRLQPDPQT
jgi:hypothetical protein